MNGEGTAVRLRQTIFFIKRVKLQCLLPEAVLGAHPRTQYAVNLPWFCFQMFSFLLDSHVSFEHQVENKNLITMNRTLHNKSTVYFMCPYFFFCFCEWDSQNTKILDPPEKLLFQAHVEAS